jgi:hypothetical protein
VSLTDPRLIAPYFTVVETDVAVAGGGVVQLCKGNPERVALMFSMPTGGQVTLSTRSTNTSSTGFYMTQSTAPITLSFHTHGGLVILAWYGYSSAFQGTITVWEILWRPPELSQLITTEHDAARGHSNRSGGN